MKKLHGPEVTTSTFTPETSATELLPIAPIQTTSEKYATISLEEQQSSKNGNQTETKTISSVDSSSTTKSYPVENGDLVDEDNNLVIKKLNEMKEGIDKKLEVILNGVEEILHNQNPRNVPKTTFLGERKETGTSTESSSMIAPLDQISVPSLIDLLANFGKS
jgi:hypothetical protein